tara:strand:+ start:53 stop:223 length:171 start_codon:yes stop_codon:yes gene_type:complete
MKPLTVLDVLNSSNKIFNIIGDEYEALYLEQGTGRVKARHVDSGMKVSLHPEKLTD